MGFDDLDFFIAEAIAFINHFVDLRFKSGDICQRIFFFQNIYDLLPEREFLFRA